MSTDVPPQEPEVTIPPFNVKKEEVDLDQLPRTQLPAAKNYLNPQWNSPLWSTLLPLLIPHLAKLYQIPQQSQHHRELSLPLTVPPLNLSSFLNTEVKSEQFSRHPPLPSNLLSNASAIKSQKQKVKVKQKVKEKEQVIVKKEEDVEKTTNEEIIHDKNCPLKDKKVPKKKAQNRIKNIPGLIMQRVRGTIKVYFSTRQKMENEYKRLAYVDTVLRDIPPKDKQELLSFLEGYEKNWKTWNTIQIFLKKNLKYAVMFLNVILQFFTEDGLEDFNDWMVSGKMGDKSKTAMLEMKEKIKSKYKNLSEEIEAEYGAHSLEKMVKKEEAT